MDYLEDLEQEKEYTVEFTINFKVVADNEADALYIALQKFEEYVLEEIKTQIDWYDRFEAKVIEL